MGTLIEYLLKALAALVILLAVLPFAILLLFSQVGIMAVFVAVFVVVTAAGSGAALLAIDFLYPQAVAVSGFLGLLWLVIPASVASVLLFDFLLEGIVLRLMQRWGMGMPSIEFVEAILGGLVTAASLAMAARLIPEVGLSSGAALAAGLTGAFVRYFAGLCLGEISLGGETDLLDEETD